MAKVDSLLRTDYKPVDKRDELHTVLGWLTGDSNKVPIVMDGVKPFGIVNERALMSRKLEHKAHIENYTLATRALPKTASSQEAAARMSEFRASYVPIMDERERVAGYVTALDVARDGEMSKLARDLALPVKGLQESQSIGDALHLFSQEYVPFLPVMNNGKIVGVLPRRQVVRMEMNMGDKGRKDARGEKVHPLNDLVGGFMDGDTWTVRPSATMDAVLDAVEKRGYAIVMENGGPVLGMITPETLVRQSAK